MIPEHLLPITVTWQQPGTATDEYNDDVDDWTSPTESEIAVYIEQQTTTEIVDGRNTVVTRLLLVTNELGIKPRDRIVWDDQDYALDGDTGIFYTPAGPHHAEGTLLKVAG